MDTYTDKLAPWEMRSVYYKDVKFDNKVKVNNLKIILKKQTEEMIAFQIAASNEIVSSPDRSEDAIQEIGYDIKSIGQGMSGLKAAFEWGISDVVWFIERKTEDFQNIMMSIYRVPDRLIDELRGKADNAVARNDMESALERFTELHAFIKDDFATCISLGIIYLFHKIDRDKALAFFERAVKYARKDSAYYTSYALLYKALIKRDLGLIEEAEICSGEAVKLSPELTEAKYQNAQYNAILNRPDESIPLLKKVIKEDIVYCMKICREQDFVQISSEISELFEEIRDEKNKKVNDALGKKKKDVALLNNTIKAIEKRGYDVSKESKVELFEEGNNEIEKLVQNNSIIDAHIAETMLSLLSNKIRRKKDLLKMKGNKIHLNLDEQIQALSNGMAGKKKKGGPVSFLIHFLCGQIVALPIGWHIGIPLGIYITEGLLFAICFYINVILPQSQWAEVSAKQNEQGKLLRVMKKL